ncbi:esterase/lipase family protein [Kitasatospora sp. NPDC058032]|uniref:esterase/lipase family protein n=1 Tax=Kitasatospora sp. NPDC058032 TaxID=3346307 RepID=UPI0036DDC789
MPARDRVAVVFVHGFFSGPHTWDPLVNLLEEDEEMKFADVHRFPYSSPKLRLRPDRRIPDFNDLADRLRTFLELRADRYERFVLVAHSQGGLVVQRFLSRVIADTRGPDLASIKSVVLFACPNEGSEFALSLRVRFLRNPQEQQLRPLHEQVQDAQRRVLEKIVYAKELGPGSCPIPFHVYGGTEDNIVRRSSAQSNFPQPRMLAGDHSGIIRPTSPDADVYQALRTHVLEASQTPGPQAAVPVAGPPHPGDRDKAQRFLRALPPHAPWLRGLRTQNFYTHSGKVDRLFDEAVTELMTDPVWYVDPALHEADAACQQAAQDLNEATEGLFADPLTPAALAALDGLAHPQDSYVLRPGQYRPGVTEHKLHELRVVFFERYDALVRLLNERSLLTP